MKYRSSQLVFFACEALVLLAVVLPVTHVRAIGMRALLGDAAPDLVPHEPAFILARSLLAVLVLQVAYVFRDLYQWGVSLRPQLVVIRLVEACMTTLVLLPILYYSLDLLDRAFGLGGSLLRLQIHPMLVVGATGAAFLTSYGLRMRWPRWLRSAKLAERVAVVGHGADVDLVVEEMRRHHDPGVEFLGSIDEHGTLGGLEDAVAIVEREGVQRLVLAEGRLLSSEALLELRRRDVAIDDVATFYERVTGRVSLDGLSRTDVLSSSQQRAGLLYAGAQRLLDVAAASAGLLLLSPICVVVAVAIKLTSPGPVLYRQERVGLNGRTFTLAKFRSMRADAEKASGPVWASKNDTRITRLGRWLRKTRLDEVPQLWSVIVNDMSLVGPRPERAFFVAELEREIPNYARRHLVKPGVTGWAQINYSYGNTVDDAFIKLQYDLYYIKHRSLAMDIAILLRTVKVVVLRKGAV